MTASEVKSHSSIDRFLVVFHSPTGMAETGLLACRSEKTDRASRFNGDSNPRSGFATLSLDLSAYVYICASTHQAHIPMGSVLGSLDISSTTGLAAVFVDKQKNASSQNSAQFTSRRASRTQFPNSRRIVYRRTRGLRRAGGAGTKEIAACRGCCCHSPVTACSDS